MCSIKGTVRSNSSFSAALSQYKYPPLKKFGTVRIILLEPGQPDDSLKGKLEEVPVDSLGSYEALSYVWADLGQSHRQHEIIIRN
jgi:hypothetical protein